MTLASPQVRYFSHQPCHAMAIWNTPRAAGAVYSARLRTQANTKSTLKDALRDAGRSTYVVGHSAPGQAGKRRVLEAQPFPRLFCGTHSVQTVMMCSHEWYGRRSGSARALSSRYPYLVPTSNAEHRAAEGKKAPLQLQTSRLPAVQKRKSKGWKWTPKSPFELV